MNCKEISF